MRVLQVNRYKGYLMRSHSETRWAALMDALGIRWLYEPRPVETRHGMYLPDFILPLAGIAVEVKGPQPTEQEIDKAEDAGAALGMPVVLVCGQPRCAGTRLVGGLAIVVFGKARIRYPTEALSDLVRQADPGIWAQLMKASRVERYLPTRPAGEAVDEVLFAGLLSRQEGEKIRRDAADRMNKEKNLKGCRPGKAETAISALAAVVVGRVNHHELRRAG